MATDPTYVEKVHADGPDKITVESGGSIDFLAGALVAFAGVDNRAALAAAVATPVAGAAAGYKIARGGAAALDGTNPTPIATGLATIVAGFVQLRGTSAPGDNTSVLTVDYTGSDGTLNVYGWKNTGGTDPTLVASTGTESFDWFVIGT
jgi:hypothetical protein